MYYFDTLMMYLFRLTLKVSRIKKIYVSENVWVINLGFVVMVLPFGFYVISTTRCGIKMWWRGTPLIPMTKSTPLSEVRMPPLGPRSYTFIMFLFCIVSRISMLAPNGSIITAGSRLTTYSYSETKISFISWWFLHIEPQNKVSKPSLHPIWAGTMSVRLKLKSVKIIKD